MNAQLKALYLAQTKQQAIPYRTNASACSRLWKIFRTANLGRFRSPFFNPPAGAVGMGTIWALLSPLAATPTLIPGTRATFDPWAQQMIEHIAVAYSAAAPHPLGIAQKTLNLFLKDLWAWNKFTVVQEDCLHAPIDRIIYQKFRKPPNSWKSWSYVKWTTPAEFATLWSDYTTLQDALRTRAKLISSPALAIQPIMLEHLLWGGV